ncbi:MAG: ECF transporter S component [Cellulosilyticaceae bacterium]
MTSLKSTKSMVLLGIFCAIEILLAFTPLGFIPLGFTRATTIHIPVILGAIILGPLSGCLLGLLFGILSIIINTVNPTVTSFVFSPFYSLGEFSGNFYSIIIAIIPRVAIALLAYITFIALKRLKRSNTFAYIGAGIVGSLTNTFLVLLGIYVFFGEHYAAAKNIPFETLFTFIMGIIGINGIPEAIVAAVIVTAIGKSLSPILSKYNLTTTR